jgi:hypothetical protein
MGSGKTPIPLFGSVSSDMCLSDFHTWSCKCPECRACALPPMEVTPDICSVGMVADYFLL